MHHRLPAVLALSLALVACGGDDGASGEPAGAATGAGGVISAGGSDGGGAGGLTAASGGAGLAGTPGAGGAAGGATGGSAGAPQVCDGPLLPLAVGNTWTYQVTDSLGALSTKTTTVGNLEAVGGTGPNAARMAFHVVTSKLAGGVTDTTESWQEAVAEGTVVRYREISYQAGTTTVDVDDSWDPYKLRVDGSPAHTQAGAAWTEAYTETKLKAGVVTSLPRSDGWVVDAVDVPCGPVKGEMLSCLRVRKTVDGASAGKTYLYARCVGKVREEGTQTEVLTDYQVN